MSVPTGATIFLDGTDTGLLTPAVLSGLAPERYQVSVALAGYVAAPDRQNVDVYSLITAYPDTFVLSSTALSIDSSPQGARIFLDGLPTGEVTPAVIGALEAGQTAVHVELDGYHHGPAATVTVVEGVITDVPADSFRLRSKRTTLLEGFSNVDCAGCPELADNVFDLQHRDSYGLDRLLYVKYSLSFPGPQDPHTTVLQDQRAGYYLIPSIPALFLDGVKVTGTSANNTPFADELEPLVTDRWTDDPGFLIDVTGTFGSPDVTAAVTLTALRDVDLQGLKLHVILAQSDVHYDEPPGSEGETDFHWILRERAFPADPLRILLAGETHTLLVDLARGTWDLETLYLFAFVQDDDDKSILQAGSTALDPALHAQHFLNKSTRPASAGTSGGK